MAETRTEQDFLGKKEVPIDAYYGVQTMRAIENFPITGYRLDDDMIKAYAIVKKAAARANCEVGLLDETKAKYIMQAAQEVIDGKLHDQFMVDPIQGGAGTSINLNTTEVIANRALELMGAKKGDYKTISPNSDVNKSMSTNDSFPTAIHLSCLMHLKRVLPVLQQVHDDFLAKSKEFDQVIKMGRTHLQDAVPVRLGQEFAAYAHVLERDIDRLTKVQNDLYPVNMGGTAIGTGLNSEPEYIKKVVQYIAEYSGFPMEHDEDMIDGTQNLDAYLVLSGAMKTCMLDMTKVMSDLRLMTSGPRCGLHEINLPARQPGSSIMPGKVNPVMCEVVNQSCYQICGNDLTVSLGCENGQFELNVMEPVIAFNLLQSLSIMEHVFTVFDKYCLQGITANEDQCKYWLDRSVGVITALNPHVGYETAALTAKEAYETGRPVREVIVDRGVLTKDEVDTILHPMEMTTPGVAGKELLEKKTNKKIL